MKPNEPQRTGDPTVATLLTWLIPGAGHLYVGKVHVAVIGFLVIEALYLAGVLLSQGMFLEYLPPEMRGRFAAALTPEAGNLGALLLHVRQYGFGGAEPRPWPAWMDLGTALTATSGILNLILASHANLAARVPVSGAPRHVAQHDPALCTALTWVLPGLGHIMQGRKARGIVALVLLVGLFGLATMLAQGSNLDRERHFYYWAGQVLLGPVALVAEFAHGHPRLESLPAYKDAGIVIGSIAGMLNVLLMLDVYGYGEARVLGRAAAPTGVAVEADVVATPLVSTAAPSTAAKVPTASAHSGQGAERLS
jgi:TM2 domain-containing membrane protein YozV